MYILKVRVSNPGQAAEYPYFILFVVILSQWWQSPVCTSVIWHQIVSKYFPIHHLPITYGLYRVSQEERAKLRESVPYVKLYRYNPKHLYPKLNGYGDNGHRKVWASGVNTSVTSYSSTAHARQQYGVMQWPWRMLYSTVALTSQDNGQLRPVWSTWKPKDKYDSIASVFVFQFNGFMSLTSYFDVKYRY